MPEVGVDGVGLGTEISEEHIDFLMDHGKRGIVVSGIISSTARDIAGSPSRTPTTTLRKGLIMGRLAADGKFFEYVDAGTGDPALGPLMDTKNLLGNSGVAEDAGARIHVGGYYDQALLLGLDAGGKVNMKALGALFKEDIL